MIGHMNREDVVRHAEAVYKALREQHNYSAEQTRRIATHIVRLCGSLKLAKEQDLKPSKDEAQ